MIVVAHQAPLQSNDCRPTGYLRPAPPAGGSVTVDESAHSMMAADEPMLRTGLRLPDTDC
jgi:hypothetical protein